MSKPLSKQVKTVATNRPRLQGFIRGLGQLSHQIKTSIEVRSAGHRVTSIKPLDDVKALNKGGDIISELFLFSFALGIMAWEYKYSSDKAAVKVHEAKLEKENEAKHIADALHSLEHRLGDLEKRSDGWGILWKKGEKAEEKSKAIGAMIDSIASGKGTHADIKR